MRSPTLTTPDAPRRAIDVGGWKPLCASPEDDHESDAVVVRCEVRVAVVVEVIDQHTRLRRRRTEGDWRLERAVSVAEPDGDDRARAAASECQIGVAVAVEIRARYCLRAVRQRNSDGRCETAEAVALQQPGLRNVLRYDDDVQVAIVVTSATAPPSGEPGMVIVAWEPDHGAVVEEDANRVHADRPVNQVEESVFVEVALFSAKFRSKSPAMKLVGTEKQTVVQGVMVGVVDAVVTAVCWW